VPVPWGKQLEGILVGAFGDRVAIGFLFRQLKPVTPEEVRLCIKENRQLFAEVPEEDWQNYRKLASTVNPKRLTNEIIIKEFRKRRLDLLNVIWSIPEGRPWIYGQVNILREKLGLPKEST
jgi:hypothetical protein